MFLHLSVILSTGGMSASVHAGIHPPWQTPPWADTHPRADTPQADGYCSGRYASHVNIQLDLKLQNG